MKNKSIGTGAEIITITSSEFAKLKGATMARAIAAAKRGNVKMADGSPGAWLDNVTGRLRYRPDAEITRSPRYGGRRAGAGRRPGRTVLP